MLQVQAGHIKKPIAKVVSTVKGKGTFPIAGLVIFDTERGRIWSDDGTTAVVAKCEAIINEQQPMFAVESDKLHRMISALGDDKTIKFELKTGHVVVSSGRSRFKLKALPKDEIPEPPKPESASTFTIRKDDLAEAFNDVLPFCGKNDARAYLNGICVEASESEIRLTATNGHALSHVALKPASVKGDERNAIIKPDGIRSALNQLDKEWAFLVMSENLWALSDGETTMIGRFISGKYADYQRVLMGVKNRNNGKVSISAEQLKQALARISPFAESGNIIISPESEGVALKTLSKEQAVSGEDVLEGATTEQFNVELGMSLRYLESAIKTHHGDTITLLVPSNPQEAIFISEQTDVLRKEQVIMPVRL